MTAVHTTIGSVGFITIAYWIAATAIGSLVAGLNLKESVEDFRFVNQAHIENGRPLVAKVALWTESSRLVAHLLLLVSGILVAANQFNANPPGVSLYVRGVILLTITILVVHTLLARWLRHKLNADD